MPLLQILSDLHLETPKQYDLYEITPKAPYLALLGDIGNIGSPSHRSEMLAFLRRQLGLFRAVLFVPGNHEAWHATWPETTRVLRDFESQVAAERTSDPSLGRFILLDRASFRLPSPGGGDILILGCSLFSHIPADRAAHVEASINDFYNTGDAWTAAAHNAAHDRDLAWLNAETAAAESDPSVASVAVLTHWSPSLDPRACDPAHVGSAISSGFATDLADEPCWGSAKLALWACGHTHFNFDFQSEREGLGPVRVFANQRGYYFRQAAGFDEEAAVEV